jgi:hypothetical protein
MRNNFPNLIVSNASTCQAHQNFEQEITELTEENKGANRLLRFLCCLLFTCLLPVRWEKLKLFFVRP